MYAMSSTYEHSEIVALYVSQLAPLRKPRYLGKVREDTLFDALTSLSGKGKLSINLSDLMSEYNPIAVQDKPTDHMISHLLSDIGKESIFLKRVKGGKANPRYEINLENVSKILEYKDICYVERAESLTSLFKNQEIINIALNELLTLDSNLRDLRRDKEISTAYSKELDSKRFAEKTFMDNEEMSIFFWLLSKEDGLAPLVLQRSDKLNMYLLDGRRVSQIEEFIDYLMHKA